MYFAFFDGFRPILMVFIDQNIQIHDFSMVFCQKSINSGSDFVQKLWFSLIFAWKIMNLHVLFDKNHQNQSTTIKTRKIHSGAFSEFFPIFLVKLHFSRIFQLFGIAPWRYFRDFARSAMQSIKVYTWGACTGQKCQNTNFSMIHILFPWYMFESYIKCNFSPKISW